MVRELVREVPIRVATGAYIAHSGWDKWRGDPEQAVTIHRMATGAFPFLSSIPPERFLRMLSIAEMTTGALLLGPVPSAVAGSALTGFSGALLTMYLRTPSLHKRGSVWPTPAGIAVSKDVWMLGIGLTLLTGGLSRSTHGSCGGR